MAIYAHNLNVLYLLQLNSWNAKTGLSDFEAAKWVSNFMLEEDGVKHQDLNVITVANKT